MPLDILESINPPFSSSPLDEMREAFQKMGLSSRDVLLELGCGEAHNLILAAEEFGASGIGYEFLDSVYDRAIKNIQDHNLQNSILVRRQSLYELQEEDVERATVAYLYLSNTANQILEPFLKQYSIKILTRIFDLPRPGKNLTQNIKLYDDMNTKCDQPKIAGTLVKIMPRDNHK